MTRAPRTRLDLPTKAMVLGGLAGALALGVASTIAAVLWRGAQAVPAAGLAIVIVVGFFTSGILALDRLLRLPAIFSLGGALTLFFLQAAGLLVLASLLQSASAIDRPSFALVALVVIVAWQVAAALAWSKSRQLVYELDEAAS